MKKYFGLRALALSFLLSAVAGAFPLRADKADAAKSESDARKYYAYAEEYRKKADASRAQGQSELADVQMKCAAAKQKMAEAYETGDNDKLAEGKKEYAEARKELESAQEGGDGGAKAKAAKLKDQAAKYEKAAADFQKKAETLSEDDPMVEVYSKLNLAYLKVAEGYKNNDMEKVKAGFDDYNAAHKERDRINKAKEKRKVKKPVTHENTPAPSPAAPAQDAPAISPRKNSDKLPDFKLD